MESLNSVDALNENIDNIDNTDNIDKNAVALKNKIVNNNCVTNSKLEIVATAQYNPEEEEEEEEKEKEIKEELNEIEKRKRVTKLVESIEALEKGNNRNTNNSSDRKVKENVINEGNDIINNEENEEDLIQKSIEASLKSQEFKDVVDHPDEEFKDIAEHKQQEHQLKEEEETDVKEEIKEDEIEEEIKEDNVEEEIKDDIEENIKEVEVEEEIKEVEVEEIKKDDEDIVKEKEEIKEEMEVKNEESNISENSHVNKKSSTGPKENVLVNKLINKLQDEEMHPLGSVESLSKRKLHMNKKFQELRDSQAHLDRAMSTEEHFVKKEVRVLSDDNLSKYNNNNSEDDEEKSEENDSESKSDDDEAFDIELIRKFEKRNTIHIPLHSKNYANINSAYLADDFYNIKITEGIDQIIKGLFSIMEENIIPITQSDCLSKIFLKNVGTSKEDDAPDFDITTISDEVSDLVKEEKYEEAYNLVVLKVNNNYRIQICEEILTTINSIIVLFCLGERVQNCFRDYYTQNFSKLNRNSLLEVMNTVDIISPPEKIILANCAYYLIHSKNKKLAPETYKELASALSNNQDYNYSLHVLDDMGRQHWDKKVYQIALDLCIKMKPQKLAYAESLLEDYGKPYIVSKNENSLVPIIISTPLMIGVTKQEIKEMRNYYKELLRVFKWKNALDNFETAKNAIYTKKEMLQLKNAMLELCVTYKEFQHGWSIFQGMTECNKNTAQVAITLCREALNYNNGENEQETYRIGWVNRAWDIVISLKEWAIYNMPMIVGKKSKTTIKMNKDNMIHVSDCVYNKLKDYYKSDKNEEGGTSDNKKSTDVSKKKKSIFKNSNKPVELPKNLAHSNFDLTNIDRSSMISIIAFVFHEILCIFEMVPNLEIFILHLVEIYNFIYENNINELLSDEYLIRPIIRFCLKCRLGERYKKFTFNIPKDESILEERSIKFSKEPSVTGDINEEEAKMNIEKMGRRGRCMSVNKNQQMNDILYEHIKNNIRKIEDTSNENDEFVKEKNKICTKIALDCFKNICGGGDSDIEIKKCHSNTYAMILHFAILEKDKKLFEDICNDLWFARIQLDEEVMMALQLFHDNHMEDCSNCSEKDHFFSAEVTVQPYKYEKQKFVVINGVRMRTPLDLSFLKKIGTINGRPYSQEEARKFLNHCINACNPKRKLSMSI